MNAAVTRAAAVGVLSGMRSLSGIAAVSHALAERPECARGVAQRTLARSGVSRALAAAAAAELVADKLPFIGARTDPLPLTGRVMMGATAAAAAAPQRSSRVGAALIGAAAAFAAAHLAYRLRADLAADGASSALLGIAEDITVLEGASQIADGF